MYVNHTLAVCYPYVSRTLAVRYPYDTGNIQGLDGDDQRSNHGIPLDNTSTKQVVNVDNMLPVYTSHTPLGSPPSYHIFDLQEIIVISSSDIEND